MTAYFVRRLLLMIPTFIGVTLVAFMITRLVPGGPLEREILRIRTGGAMGGAGGRALTVNDPTSAIPEGALKEMKKAFDLDKPAYVAYFLWLKRVVQFDLGKSYSLREPVATTIVKRFPVSLVFGLTGFILAYLVCIPLGIAKALRHGSKFDFVSSAIVFMGYSIPGWAMGALLLMLLASGRFLDWYPLGGIHSNAYDQLPSIAKKLVDQEQVVDEFDSFDWDKMPPLAKFVDRTYHMILPVFCYMLAQFASLTVLVKNSLMENLGQDYVRTAFAKGLAPRRVIYLHTLRNSLIPLATGLGHALGVVMAGSYLIESVFNIDGVGYLGYTSILGRDYTVVMGILVINTLLLLFGNLFSDILYALIDPRIRFE